MPSDETIYRCVNSACWCVVYSFLIVGAARCGVEYVKDYWNFRDREQWHKR